MLRIDFRQRSAESQACYVMMMERVMIAVGGKTLAGRTGGGDLLLRHAQVGVRAVLRLGSLHQATPRGHVDVHLVGP